MTEHSPAPVLSNPRADRVRAVRALVRRQGRDRAGRFLAEGPQAVREVIRYAAETVVEVYVAGEAGQRYAGELAEARDRGLHVVPVTPEVLAAMVQTDTPQGLLAVCRLPAAGADPLGDLLAGQPSLLVLLTNVRDPGNAGTVIRAADAFGADAVLVSQGSVDVHAPKVVRSTAGSLFHLPVLTGLSVGSTLERLRAHGIRTLAADGSGQTALGTLDLRTPHAWVMGNEAWGLPPQVRALCDDVVRVPIHDRVESLNLAMCAAVCLYTSAGSLGPHDD